MSKIKQIEFVLGIEPLPHRWKRLEQDITESDFDCVKREWIVQLDEKYQLFPHWITEILDAADAIRNNEELCFYTVLLKKAMRDRDAFKTEMPSLCLPQAEDRRQAYDYAPLLALLPYIPDAVKKLAGRGIPKDILSETYLGMERILEVTQIRLGHPVYNMTYFQWAQHFVDGTLLSIGRLEFELQYKMGGSMTVLKNRKGAYCLIQETERTQKDWFEGYRIAADGSVASEKVRFNKSDWERFCGPEDAVIGVHIPMGSKLTKEKVVASYQSARTIFGQAFPEYDLKGFCCSSWLMDPQLSDLLPKEANIVQFQSMYLRSEIPSAGEDIFLFLFPGEKNDPAFLPECTTLERAVKKHLLSGKKIYELQGFLPFDLVCPYTE